MNRIADIAGDAVEKQHLTTPVVEVSSHGDNGPSPNVTTAPMGTGQFPEYEESEGTSFRLFKRFDMYHKGFFGHQELKTIVKGLRLFPSLTDLKQIIRAVDTKQDGVIDPEEFLLMRRTRPMVDMLIISEFIKFNSSFSRGNITEASIRDALTAEGAPRDFIDHKVRELMSLDYSASGKVSFTELYNAYMNRVPDEWLGWIYDNVQRNVGDHKIVSVLLENGFTDQQANDLVSATRQHGRQTVDRNYVDMGRGWIYSMQR